MPIPTTSGRSSRPWPRTPARTASSMGVDSASPGNVRPQSEQVREHLDLATAACPGSDADRRDLEALGDRAGQLLRHELEHDREGAGLLDRERIVEQGARLVARLALDPNLATHSVLGLGRPTDVTHHGDPGPDN